MFGNSFQNAQTLQPLAQSQNNMFSSNQSLQQQHQQQQQPQIVHQNSTSDQQIKQPSRFEKYELRNVKEHNLFSSDSADKLSGGNTLKQRTIPNKLVKRITKTDNNTDETDKPSAPILPFKASTQFQADTFNDDFAHLYEHNKLPTKSLFDPSAFNDDNNPNEIFIDSVFNEMNENPVTFNNIFQRPERFVKAGQSSNLSSNLPWSISSTPQSKVGTPNQSKELLGTSSKQNSQRLYCSIIVYGFDNDHFSSLIDHFAKYGDIMEDMNITDSNNHYGQLGSLLSKNKLLETNEDSLNKDEPRKFPIFIGNGWVKITYDNPNSAIRALVDNGTDDGNGNILGVMPYKRKALELLLDAKLTDDLDIGEGLRGLNYDLGFDSNFADNEIGRYLSNYLLKDQKSGDDKDNMRSKTGNIKDGSKLMLKNVKIDDQKNFWNKSMGFFFGKGEI